MNAKESMKLLCKLQAPRGARTWAKGKDMRTIWDTCESGDWLRWLLDAVRYRWPILAWYEYQHVAYLAWAAYARRTTPTCDKPTTAKAWDEYQRTSALAWAEYQRVLAHAVRNLVPYPEELLKQSMRPHA